MKSYEKEQQRIERYCIEVQHELPDNVHAWVARNVLWNYLNFEGRHYMSNCGACASFLYGRKYEIHFYNSSFVRQMPKELVKAMIAHEIAHTYLSQKTNHDKCAESVLDQYERDADSLAISWKFKILELNEYSNNRKV
jgi:hypothetical protein